MCAAMAGRRRKEDSALVVSSVVDGCDLIVSDGDPVRPLRIVRLRIGLGTRLFDDLCVVDPGSFSRVAGGVIYNLHR
jgi:hypothetical protein